MEFVPPTPWSPDESSGGETAQAVIVSAPVRLRVKLLTGREAEMQHSPITHCVVAYTIGGRTIGVEEVERKVLESRLPALTGPVSLVLEMVERPGERSTVSRMRALIPVAALPAAVRDAVADIIGAPPETLRIPHAVGLYLRAADERQYTNVHEEAAHQLSIILNGGAETIGDRALRRMLEPDTLG